MPQPLDTTPSLAARQRYRDPQLRGLMDDLRAACAPHPRAKLALERAERRLKYNLKVVQGWDQHHAERAKTLLRLGNIGAANTAATLIFNEELRQHLLAVLFVGFDESADVRVAENAAREREVLA